MSQLPCCILRLQELQKIEQVPQPITENYRLVSIAHQSREPLESHTTKALQATLISPVHISAHMSRFFTQGDTSSESSSSDEEELYSEEEGVQKSEEESSEEEEASDDEASSSSDEGGKSGVSKFLRDVASSDESEDEDKVTVVKSAKDKRLEELEGVVKVIDNASKIGDWSTIATGEPKLFQVDN